MTVSLAFGFEIVKKTKNTIVIFISEKLKTKNGNAIFKSK